MFEGDEQVSVVLWNVSSGNQLDEVSSFVFQCFLPTRKYLVVKVK